MLQIATGKLFARPAERENLLRGLLYTNAHVDRESTIELATGTLTPTSSYSIRPRALIYEFIERIEHGEKSPGALISSTADPYVNDFAVVASFALNCVCTPDIELARRLTGGERGLSAREAPPSLIPRFFDKEYWCNDSDIEFLTKFTRQLIGLRRTTFLPVMRALRTYITGMHRMADDLELAYTLLVASVESLAQTTSGHENTWSSVDAVKRYAVDEALADADATTASRVRDALSSLEHGQLARRFRAFVEAHAGPDYFRGSPSNTFRLGRSDLTEALDGAYRMRSAYIHEVKALPDMLVMAFEHAETVTVERSVHLTLHGLSRLMRHAIVEFVMRQPTVDEEVYDYHLQRTGVVQMQFAPQYWMGNTGQGFEGAGRLKLEGFLQQLESVELHLTGAALTNLTEVLTEASGAALTTKKVLRVPYLALHALYNGVAPEDYKVPWPPKVMELMEAELLEPSPEALIVHAIYRKAPAHWSLELHRATFESYLKGRSKRNGLRFPRTYEAAIALELAERYRVSERIDDAVAMLSLAVENYPGHQGLLAFEQAFNAIIPILWRDILLPVAEPPSP